MNLNFNALLFCIIQLTPDQSEETEPRKAYGGHKKVKAIKINHGLYVWNSLGTCTLLFDLSLF